MKHIDRGTLIAKVDSYLQLVLHLAEQLEHVEFDCVLAVARGGYVPGEIISRIFDKPLFITRLSSYTGKLHGEVSDLGTIGEPFGRILVVDDLVDSGDSLRYLKMKYPGCVTAVLWNKAKNRDIEPDFYSARVRDGWITQPMDIFNKLGV